MKIGLGTVQFGCNYGISNKNGQVSIEEISKILSYANKQGIDTIDTACLYGSSEKALYYGGGELLREFKIITKTPKIKEELSLDENLEYFETSFKNSLSNLGQSSVYGLLFHNADNLLHPYGDELCKFALQIKKDKKVKKIGVSVYKPDELIKVMNKLDIDIVQIPLNILDQRFLPMLKELKERNIEIHCRSIFLQGLLLMNIEEIDPYFDEIKPLLKQLPQNRLKAALEFAKNIEYIDKLIIGTTKLSELQEITAAYNSINENNDYSKFSINDERYILPTNWKK